MGIWEFRSSGVTVAFFVASAQAAYLRSISANNGDSVNLFLQVHNLAAAPGGGVIPIISEGPVIPDATISIADETQGVIDRFSVGISIAWSTTQDTFTAPAGNVGWIHAMVKES